MHQPGIESIDKLLRTPRQRLERHVIKLRPRWPVRHANRNSVAAICQKKRVHEVSSRIRRGRVEDAKFRTKQVSSRHAKVLRKVTEDGRWIEHILSQRRAEATGTTAGNQHAVARRVKCAEKMRHQ